MKLVDNSTKSVLFDSGSNNDQRIFHSIALERELKEGISVPSFQSGLFGGRKVVYIADPDFVQAFKLIYTPRVLNKRRETCHWEDS